MGRFRIRFRKRFNPGAHSYDKKCVTRTSSAHRRPIVARRGLADRVVLPGCVKDPFTHLKSASLFVLPSRVEGFPLALCEALACGLTAVATDCAGGVRDIIRNGVNGVLVPVDNAAALARELSRLMGDELERQRLSARAPEVLDHFNPEKTFAEWETLFHEVVNEK